jgi:uncharacterized protein (DUF2062 family)
LTKEKLTTHPARPPVPVSRSRRFARWVRLHAIRMVRENSTPAKTGLGFALGAFIGIFPSFLIGTPIAFFVAGRLGWNRAAAIGGTTLMNPLTAPVLYSISTWLGLEILQQDHEVAAVHGFISYLREFGIAFLLGNTVLAIAVSVILGLAVFVSVRLIGRSGMLGLASRLRRKRYGPSAAASPR